MTPRLSSRPTKQVSIKSALGSYQIRKIAGCACAGNAGNVFPIDPDMHHGTCLTHVPWCMSGSLTSGFLWNRLRGKRSRHSRRMRNPQFCVSGKRPIGLADGLAPLGARPSAGTTMTFEEGQHISPPQTQYTTEILPTAVLIMDLYLSNLSI